MSNLIQEYRNRHGIDSVFAVDEGVLFFEKKVENGPPLKMVCLTSTYTKSASVCEECLNLRGSLILEIFQLSNKSQVFFNKQLHTHISPDANIVDFIESMGPDFKGYKAIPSKGDRFQEKWLWDCFFSVLSNQKNRWYNDLKHTLKVSGIPLDDKHWISHYMMLAIVAPRLANVFYEYYSLILINRKYIVMEK